MNHRSGIPTWLHGCLDYGVAALFAAAATSPALTPHVRRTFAILGTAHASYASITDYEAGLLPWLSMRQHLGLDAAGGLTLLTAGLLMRRQPAHQRTLLLTAGLAELGIVALSSATPDHGPARAYATPGYQPLDTLKPLADGVFIVDSLLPGLLGKLLPVRMTVLRLPDNTLLLHSPTRFSATLGQALQSIGPVAHLVAPNPAHWTLIKPWQQAFPQATTWAAPGLRDRRQVRRSRLRLDYDLGTRAPALWGDSIDLVMMKGGFGFHEAALFHRPSRTLVLTDLVLNLEPGKLPALARPLMRLFGSTAPDGMPPPYLRFAVRRGGQQAVTAAQEMLALQPERVVFSHGRCFESDATFHLQRSFRWLLTGRNDQLHRKKV